MRPTLSIACGTLLSAIVFGAGFGPEHRATVALDDANILGMFRADNDAEIDMSDLAERNATSPEVREYATRINQDHSKARDEARELARKLRITPMMPLDYGSPLRHLTVMTQLSQKSGEDFDRKFVEIMVDDHREFMSNLNEKWIPGARNPELRTFLGKQLPAIRAHLATAQALQHKNKWALDRG